jgi:hypothetical protein
MSMRQRCAVAAVAAILCCGAFTFEPQRVGNVEAVLQVRVAPKGPAPGLAAITYDVSLTGPAALEVAAPRLDDATGAWKVVRRSSAWTQEDDRAQVELVLFLQEGRLAKAPLPDLHVRFRDGPEAPWQEASWLEVLRHLRDVPGPEVSSGSSSVNWLLHSVLLGIVALEIAVIVGLRRKQRAPGTVPSWVRALAAVDALSNEGPAMGANVFHTRLSQVLRSYLAERFGLRAMEQTTADLLTAAREAPELAAQMEVLRAFCERCDVAKFAGPDMTAEECQESVALARQLIENTIPTAPNQVHSGETT